MTELGALILLEGILIGALVDRLMLRAQRADVARQARALLRNIEHDSVVYGGGYLIRRGR